MSGGGACVVPFALYEGLWDTNAQNRKKLHISFQSRKMLFLFVCILIVVEALFILPFFGYFVVVLSIFVFVLPPVCI